VPEDGVNGEVGEDHALCLVAISQSGGGMSSNKVAAVVMAAARFSSRAPLFSSFSLGCPFELRVESSSIWGKMKGWEPVEGRRGNLVRRCQVSGWLGI